MALLPVPRWRPLRRVNCLGQHLPIQLPFPRGRLRSTSASTRRSTMAVSRTRLASRVAETYFEAVWDNAAIMSPKTAHNWSYRCSEWTAGERGRMEVDYVNSCMGRQSKQRPGFNRAMLMIPLPLSGHGPTSPAGSAITPVSMPMKSATAMHPGSVPRNPEPRDDTTFWPVPRRHFYMEKP